jgi:uncharacterized protein YndB with AHSA1/START domain
MKQVQANVSTPRPPREVYDYLVDFANHPEWRFDVLESTLIQGETGRVGARYRQRIKQGRRELTTEVELTKAEPGREVAFRTVADGPVTARGTYRISEASGGGSRLTNDVTIETRGFVRLFEPFMGPQLRKTSARYEQALSERLA